jgi:hypothetical protein
MLFGCLFLIIGLFLLAIVLQIYHDERLWNPAGLFFTTCSLLAGIFLLYLGKVGLRKKNKVMNKDMIFCMFSFLFGLISVFFFFIARANTYGKIGFINTPLYKIPGFVEFLRNSIKIFWGISIQCLLSARTELPHILTIILGIASLIAFFVVKRSHEKGALSFIYNFWLYAGIVMSCFTLFALDIYFIASVKTLFSSIAQILFIIMLVAFIYVLVSSFEK